MRGSTFNLSILECKYFYATIGDTKVVPFNLSILECKCQLIIGPGISSRLLISPYWNVNPKRQARLPIEPTPFNLSILECKCYNNHRCLLRHRLLISPYWNVNISVKT